jgi:hypothetical protein
VIQLLVLLTLIVFAVLALRRIAATAPQLISQAGRRLAGWTAVGVLIYLAATGRLAIVVAVVGALIAGLLRLAPLLVQLFPILHRFWRQRNSTSTPGGSPGDRTTTETRYLRMELRHTTGEISGVVLQGPYAGRDLQSMKPAELATLHRECVQEDRDSAALLEAYLERVHGPDWRSRAGASNSRSASSSRMTSDEAYEILGLTPGASRDAIIQAHRRLMQRMHPDRGGSDYLAAKINGAKDTLLDA